FMFAEAATYLRVLSIGQVEGEELPDGLLRGQPLAVGQGRVRQRLPPTQPDPTQLRPKITNPGTARTGKLQRPGRPLECLPVLLRYGARHRKLDRTEDQK